MDDYGAGRNQQWGSSVADSILFCFNRKMFISARLAVCESAALANSMNIPAELLEVFDENYQALKFWSKISGNNFVDLIKKRFKSGSFNNSALQRILEFRAAPSCHLVLAVLSVKDGVVSLTDFYRIVKFSGNFLCPGDFVRITGAEIKGGFFEIPKNGIRRVFTTEKLKINFFGFQKSLPPATPFSRACKGVVPVCTFFLVRKFPIHYTCEGYTILEPSFEEFCELNGERNLRIECKQKWIVSDFSGSFSSVTISGSPEIFAEAREGKVYRVTNSRFTGAPGFFVSRNSRIESLAVIWQPPTIPATVFCDLEISSACEVERDGDFSVKTAGGFVNLRLQAKTRIFSAPRFFIAARSKLLQCRRISVKNCMQVGDGEFIAELCDVVIN